MPTDFHEIIRTQIKICSEQSVKHESAGPDSKMGLAVTTEGRLPANGLRHQPTETTTGWYVWFGEEFSSRTEFFEPICTSHFYEREPVLSQYLGLPSGYRFLIAVDHADVWFDPTLLKVD